MKAPNLEYVRPSTLAEAIGLLNRGGENAKLLAGGQSMGPMLNLRVARPQLLIDIGRLGELTRTDFAKGTLSVGAAVAHADIEDGKIPDVARGLLAETAGSIAYRAVRNRGTIGGSLSHADPVGDWCPVLMALDAIAVAQSIEGSRSIPVDQLITGVMSTTLMPGEILTEIRIPELQANARWGRYKISRKPGKFADVIAVAVIDRSVGRARLAVAIPGRHPMLLSKSAAALLNVDRADLAHFRSVARTELRDAGVADDIQLQIVVASVVRAVASTFTI